MHSTTQVKWKIQFIKSENTLFNITCVFTMQRLRGINKINTFAYFSAVWKI
jgi:hypothetical protein